MAVPASTAVMRIQSVPKTFPMRTVLARAVEQRANPALMTPPVRLAGPKELPANQRIRSEAGIRSYEGRSFPGMTQFSELVVIAKPQFAAG